MTDDPRFAWLIGLGAWIPGAVASVTPWLENLRELVAIVSTIFALGVALLALWIRKLMRDREDELAAGEADRDIHRRSADPFHSLAGERYDDVDQRLARHHLGQRRPHWHGQTEEGDAPRSKSIAE